MQPANWPTSSLRLPQQTVLNSGKLTSENLQHLFQGPQRPHFIRLHLGSHYSTMNPSISHQSGGTSHSSSSSSSHHRPYPSHPGGPPPPPPTTLNTSNLPPGSHLSAQAQSTLLFRQYLTDLSTSLFSFVLPLLPTAEELATKEEVRVLIERLIKTIEPSSRLLSFGSSCNSFGLRNSGEFAKSKRR